MKVDGKMMRTIWPAGHGAVAIIDQTRLPHELVTIKLHTLEDAVVAISSMQVRGAPLIGAAAAYGVALAMEHDATDAGLQKALRMLGQTRPTAVNLRWALDQMKAALINYPADDRVPIAWRMANEIADEDVGLNMSMGRHGLELIKAKRHGGG